MQTLTYPINLFIDKNKHKISSIFVRYWFCCCCYCASAKSLFIICMRSVHIIPFCINQSIQFHIHNKRSNAPFFAKKNREIPSHQRIKKKTCANVIIQFSYRNPLHPKTFFALSNSYLKTSFLF